MKRRDQDWCKSEVFRDDYDIIHRLLCFLFIQRYSSLLVYSSCTLFPSKASRRQIPRQTLRQTTREGMQSRWFLAFLLFKMSWHYITSSGISWCTWSIWDTMMKREQIIKCIRNEPRLQMTLESWDLCLHQQNLQFPFQQQVIFFTQQNIVFHNNNIFIVCPKTSGVTTGIQKKKKISSFKDDDKRVINAKEEHQVIKKGRQLNFHFILTYAVNLLVQHNLRSIDSILGSSSLLMSSLVANFQRNSANEKSKAIKVGVSIHLLSIWSLLSSSFPTDPNLQRTYTLKSPKTHLSTQQPRMMG